MGNTPYSHSTCNKIITNNRGPPLDPNLAPPNCRPDPPSHSSITTTGEIRRERTPERRLNSCKNSRWRRWERTDARLERERERQKRCQWPLEYNEITIHVLGNSEIHVQLFVVFFFINLSLLYRQWSKIEYMSVVDYEAQTPLGLGVSWYPTRVGVWHSYDTRTTRVEPMS